MSIVGIAFVVTLLATLLLNHVSLSDSFELKGHTPTLIAFLKDNIDESEGRTLLSQIEKSGHFLARTTPQKQKTSLAVKRSFKIWAFWLRRPSRRRKA